MTNSLPEYLFAVTGPDGAMLGHVAFAPNVFDDEDQAAMATRLFFQRVTHTPSFIRALPVEGLINDLIQVKLPTSLKDVLVDILYATDCCVRTMAELPLESHVHDAGLRCPGCGTTYRFVWDDQREALVWKWRTETRAPRREEMVKSLAEVLLLLNQHAAEDGEPTATALRDLATEKGTPA